MNFDEAIKYAKENSFVEEMLSDVVELEDVIEILENLREEYAPTVEMTKEQKDLILRNQDEDRLYETLGDGDGYYLNADYWGGLEPHEVASAYLHPETIKVIGD